MVPFSVILPTPETVVVAPRTRSKLLTTRPVVPAVLFRTMDGVVPPSVIEFAPVAVDVPRANESCAVLPNASTLALMVAPKSSVAV